MKILHWIFESMARTYFSLAVLGLGFVAVTGALAAQTTSWDVTNSPQMYLDVSITPTQTSNIKLSSLTRNSSTAVFPTTTGGVLRIRQGFRVEDISYTSATIDSSNVTTLVGVTRNLCWNIANSLSTCGDGQAFSKGAVVELSIDARLLNFKLNRDRANTGTGIFSLRSNQTTQPWLFPNRVTTAQRDAFTAGTSTAEAPIIYNSTVGTMQYWNGTAWINFGSGSIVNATSVIAGKVEMATQTNLSGSVLADDSGAPLSIGTDLVIRHSSGSENARNKVVSTNNTGYLSGSLLASGTPSKANILLGNMQWVSSGSVGLSQNVISGALIPSLGLNLVDPSGDTTVASSSFTSIDPTNLSGSIVVAKNDLLMINVLAEIQGAATPCDVVQFDVSVRDGTGNPESVTGGNGFPPQQCTTVLNDNYSATFFWKPSSGGTLYMGLRVKSDDGDGVIVRAGTNITRLQVVKFPQ